MSPVLITNNHIINEEILNTKDIKINLQIEDDGLKVIELNNRIKYTNKEYDTTIIEILQKDNINNYLELDDIIINDILDILDKLYEDKIYNFNHKCCTKGGSSSLPILNKNNNKIIGIHKEGNNNKQYNKGTFINYPIKECIEQNLNEQLLERINKKYYFLQLRIQKLKN